MFDKSNIRIHHRKTSISLLSISALLAILEFASLFPTSGLPVAYAQFGGGGGGFGNGQPLQIVSGNYTNSDAGLQIILPANWTGSLFQSRNGTITTIRVVPNDVAQPQSQGFRVADSMTIRIIPKNIMAATIAGNGTSQQFMLGQGRNFTSRANLTCTRDTPQNVTVNYMQGVLQTAQCSSTSFSFMTKSYSFQTQNHLFTVSFMSTSPAGFSKYVPAFDTSVNTLKIENTIQAPSMVVPEFPAAGIVIALAGAVGIVSLIMRTRNSTRHMRL